MKPSKLRTLFIGAGCFLTGLTSMYLVMAPQDLHMVQNMAASQVEQANTNITKSAIDQAPSETATDTKTASQAALADKLNKVVQEDWSTLITELSTIPFDALAREKLALEIAEGPVEAQMAFLDQSFLVSPANSNLIGVQRLVLKHLSKAEPDYAINLLKDFSPEQREDFGKEIIKGYAKNDALAALSWINNDASAEELDFLGPKGVDRARSYAIKQVAKQNNDLFKAFELTETLEYPKAQFQLQKELAKSMVEEGLDLAMSQALSSGPNGGTNQDLLMQIVGAWSDKSPAQATRYLLDNNDLLDSSMARPLSVTLLKQGYDSEYQQLFERSSNPEVKAAMAKQASITKAQQNEYNSALNWLSKLPEGEYKSRAIVASAYSLKPSDRSEGSLNTQLSFIEQITPVNSKLQTVALYATLNNWKESEPKAVTQFVMNLPSDQAKMKAQLLKRLGIRED